HPCGDLGGAVVPPAAQGAGHMARLGVPAAGPPLEGCGLVVAPQLHPPTRVEADRGVDTVEELGAVVALVEEVTDLHDGDPVGEPPVVVRSDPFGEDAV